MSDDKFGPVTFFQTLLLQVQVLVNADSTGGSIKGKVAALQREHDRVVAAAEKDVNRLRK